MKRHPVEGILHALRRVWGHQEVTIVFSGINEDKQIEENIHIACEFSHFSPGVHFPAIAEISMRAPGTTIALPTVARAGKGAEK